MSEDEPSRPAFDAPETARGLLRSIRSGMLATLDAGGAPFASLVGLATAIDGSPLMLLSRLAGHTRNLEADPRASLLLAERGKGDPLAHPRLTILGRAAPTPDPRARRRYLARNPKAALYADFPDFSFYTMEMTGLHLNGGFARAAELTPSDILSDPKAADALAAIEEDALAHLNADHREALALYATVLAGAAPVEWRATGLDPDGLDLAAGDAVARIAFPEAVRDPGRLRAVLKVLADEARRRSVDEPRRANSDAAG